MAGAAHARTHTHTHTHTHSKMTHTKPIVAQPSEWLAGKVKCSVISSRQTQSLEMQFQPESPRGMPGLSQKCRQSHKLTALLFPSVSPSSITGHFYQASVTVCVCADSLFVCVCVCLICSACLIMLTREDGLYTMWKNKQAQITQ